MRQHRHISQRKFRRVALIIESGAAPRRRMLTGLARYMHEHEPWEIYLKPSNVEKSLGQWLRDWHGDGIIVALQETDTDFVVGQKLPVVDMVGVLRHEGVPLVHANDHSIGRVGAEHLMERGFRNLGFCEYPEWFFSVHRREGFDQALAQRQMKGRVHRMPPPVAGRGGPKSWERQQRELSKWLLALPKPAGVMASTDLMGQQVLEACQRLEIKVPEEVAVVGADNDEPICNVCFPPLSSVIINDDQRGYQAAAVLDRLMNGEAAPTEPMLIEPGGVACRASTDILAIDDEALATALRFIRDHACEQIGVDDVVDAVPLSRSVLQRRFRKAVGRSVNDEIIRVRLNRAIELLSETSLELKAIALKAGFGTPSYMGAVFRQKLRTTPGSYRDKAHAATAH